VLPAGEGARVNPRHCCHIATRDHDHRSSARVAVACVEISEHKSKGKHYAENQNSSYARGIDLMNTTYNFLDLTAKGRDEKPGAAQDWVRYHDEYTQR
jgi:predicted dithiol-disulfide oxidoreductase (DUF899 family)